MFQAESRQWSVLRSWKQGRWGGLFCSGKQQFHITLKSEKQWEQQHLTIWLKPVVRIPSQSLSCQALGPDLWSRISDELKGWSTSVTPANRRYYSRTTVTQHAACLTAHQHSRLSTSQSRHQNQLLHRVVAKSELWLGFVLVWLHRTTRAPKMGKFWKWPVDLEHGDTLRYTILYPDWEALLIDRILSDLLKKNVSSHPTFVS